MSILRPRRSTEATLDQLVVTGAAGGYGVDPIDGDVGFRPANAGPRDFPIWTMEKIRAYSIAAYRSNPMARAIIDTYTSFCVGDSGLTLQCPVPQVRAVAEEYWNDPLNLFNTHQDLMLRDHLLMGESAYEMLVGPSTGVCRMSVIDPSRVIDVGLRDGNPLWPATLEIRQPDGDSTTRSIVSVDDFTGRRSGEVMWWASFRALLTDRRGVPFLSPVLDGLDSYDSTIANLVDRTALARYLVWDVTVDGDQKAVDDFVASRKGMHAPRSGTVEVHNDKIKWSPQTASVGADEDKTTSHTILTSVAAGVGLAKAQPLDCQVLTPSGWRRMGDLDVGDEVTTPTGAPSRITGVYPQGEIEIFDVRFSDGAATRASADHLWFTQTANDRKHHRGGTVKTTAQIAASLRSRTNAMWPSWNHYVPLVHPIDASTTPETTIDPYVVGVLLGDGHMRVKTDGAVEVLLSSADRPLVEEINGLLWQGEFRRVNGSTCDYRYCGPEPGLRADLEALALVGSRSHTKFIPDAYRNASPKSRLALLQGLLDSDGSPSARTSAMFVTVSERLAGQVRDLVWGLGGVATLSTMATTYTYRGRKRAGRLAYRLRITLPAGDRYFRLDRKQSQIVHGQKIGRAVRTIRSVTPAGVGECQCIAIADPAHLYVTDDYIVTHNTWLAEPEDANRATSLSMAEPVRRRVGGIQNLWLGYITDLVRFAVDQAVEAGRLAPEMSIPDPTGVRTVPTSSTVTITGPEVAAADAQVNATILSNLSTALSGLSAAGLLSPEAAKVAARKAWEDYCGIPYDPQLDHPSAHPDDLADYIANTTIDAGRAGAQPTSTR